jgi:dTDP-6-deoxy-L-talose 4-dehydrogenase [NAD(P)+]
VALTHPGDPRVTVLGGTGFAGRHIAAAFVAAGWHTTVAARRPPLDPPSPGTVFASVDLTSSAGTLAAALGRTEPDVVVNAAGAYWDMTPGQLEASLVGTTRRLLEAIPLLGCRPRLIHLGSVMEYAPAPGRQLLDERTPVDATTPYGAAKLRATEAVRRAVEYGEVDALVLRVTNTIGPGVDASSLLGKVAQALSRALAAGGDAHVLLAPLHAERDYLDVRDLGEAVVAAADHGLPGQLVNIGSGSAVSVRELVDLLIAVSGVTTVIEEREDAPSSPGAVADWLAVDPATAAALFGWRSRRPIGAAVSDLWHAEIDGLHSSEGRSLVDAKAR